MIKQVKNFQFEDTINRQEPCVSQEVIVQETGKAFLYKLQQQRGGLVRDNSSRTKLLLEDSENYFIVWRMENKVISIINGELFALDFLKPNNNQKIEMSHIKHQKKEAEFL